jgi:hypothetical protein
VVSDSLQNRPAGCTGKSFESKSRIVRASYRFGQTLCTRVWPRIRTPNLCSRQVLWTYGCDARDAGMLGRLRGWGHREGLEGVLTIIVNPSKLGSICAANLSRLSYHNAEPRLLDFGCAGSRASFFNCNITSPRSPFPELDCPDTIYSSSNISTMDVISALTVAAGILAIVEFGAELILTSNQSQGESLLNDKEERFTLERLRTLRHTLSAVNFSVGQQFSTGASQPSSEVLALQELASSCIEDFEKLLEDVENILRDSSGRGRSQPWTDKRARFRSILGGRFDEKIERLSRTVTVHVSSIIRCAMWLIKSNSLGDTNT